MERCQCSKQKYGSKAPEFTRVITDDSPTLPYSTRRLPWEPTHWGQMKLLISEIEFLTPFFGESFTVVYAGAAPGIHMPILAAMFPTMHFILVDPAPSMMATGDYPTITVTQQKMTEKLAQEFRRKHGDNLLFISDVRIGSDDVNEAEEAMQERIHRDMEAQRTWMDIMSPQSSILKFRLPWNLPAGNGMTLYPEGTMMLPVYGKRLTHEARLIVDRGAQDFLYENSLYEGQMSSFNRKLRTALYPSEACVFHMLGLNVRPSQDHSTPRKNRCYDCTAFQEIVGEYLLKSKKIKKSRLNYTVIEDECAHIEIRLTELYHDWEIMQQTRP